MQDVPTDELRRAAPLAIFSLDTATIGADQGIAAWRSATAALFDAEPLDADANAFRAVIRSYAIGPLLFGRAGSTAQRFVRDSAVVARAAIDHLLVQLYVAGGYRGTTTMGPIEVGSGDISVLDLAREFATRADGEFENLNLIVPRAMLVQAGIDVEALHGMVLRSDTALAQLLGNHLASLDRLADTMTVADGEAAADIAAALLVAALRHAPERQAAVTIDPDLARVRGFIDAHLSDSSLDADRIAAGSGMSRAALYRLFEVEGGVVAYLRTQRMRRALFELSRGDGAGPSIAQVAMQCGYENATSFTRAFRSSFGVSPTAVRMSARRRWPPPPVAAVAAAPGEHPLTGWIRNLIARRASLAQEPV